MSVLEVRLFGQVQVEWEGYRLEDLSAKTLELLCFLLLHRDRAHTREGLAEILWPEARVSQSRKYLRQTLWQLHSRLAALSGGQRAGTEGPLLTLNPGWVRLNHQAGWWLDVAVFERAYVLCRETAGQDLTDLQVRDLEAAVGLYQGELIESWYQDWCIYERDRLQLTYLAMLEKLMRHCEARAWYARGVEYGQSILRYDPARESTHRQLMRLHYWSGDRTTALRQYDRCAAAVAEQFSVEPTRVTATLYQQIRTDSVDDGYRTQGGAPLTAEAHDDLLIHQNAWLDHLQASLSALQRQVQQQVTMISHLQAGLSALQVTTGSRALTDGQETAEVAGGQADASVTGAPMVARVVGDGRLRHLA
jgi:DNA-binding SARP family transcriptional activator